jgi:hypothetical protein
MTDNIVPFPIGASAKVGSSQPSNATADVIKAAQAVIERLECNLKWDTDWRVLILALGAGRDLALRIAKANRPHGPKYRAAISAWLRDYGFDRIEKADRSRLMECFDHLDEINTWRSAQPEMKELNHPRTVLSHWKRSLRSEPSDKEDTTAGGITIDSVIAWLTTAAAATDRARVIEALAITRCDVPAAVAADIVQHAVRQTREVAEKRRAAQAKCVADVRAALATSAPAAHRVEAALAVLQHHNPVKRAKHWSERMDPKSSRIQNKDKSATVANTTAPPLSH